MLYAGIAQICKFVIFLSICVLLNVSYNISIDINSSIYIRNRCGNKVVEKELLRYKAVFDYKKYRILWVLFFIVLSAYLVMSIDFGLKFGSQLNAGVVESFIIYSIVTVIILLNIYFNGISFNRMKDDYRDYAIEMEYIIRHIKDIFSRKAGGTIFISGGLQNTFPPDFLKNIVSRWKDDRTNKNALLNSQDEVIYTDIGIIEEIERALFNKDAYNNIVGLKENSAEILLGMLMPAKGKYLYNEIVEKTEISFIYDAYLSWACKNRSFNEELDADCNNLKERLHQLPDLSAFDKTTLIKSRLNRLIYLTWIGIILITYTLYIMKKSEQQTVAIFAFVLTILTILYYVIIFRDKV